MNVDCPDRLIAARSNSTPLGRTLTRAFKFGWDLPPDFAELLMRLPGQPSTQGRSTESSRR